ncbi:uncharacterized protein Bfra_000519 [Botrytis fragariae]|uniref:Uncharacterized protein n=1 Tax=Botrytis fragariae TaxID=1964551 RepID=A0A8H6B381_9HELO|nr:uncharacterized protein Bfra_000519 [Botrytis fragariae]KAF5878353.1 hypothetical protein Bfra_000519 [Botrytis fragariae]
MSTPFRSKKIRKEERYEKEKNELNDKIYGSGNQRSSYTSSRHSNSDSSSKKWDIHDNVRREAAQLNPSDSGDNTETERRLYDRYVRSQERRNHKTSGTEDQTDLSQSKRKK